jgi:hypothetical protein
MMHTLELARRATRLRASAVVSGLLAVLAGACNSADNLNPNPPVAANFDSAGTTDSLGLTDSMALAEPMTEADSLGVADSVALADSLAAAGVATTDESSLAPSFALASFTNRMAFGTFDCTPSGLSAYNLCNRSAGKWTAAEIRALQARGVRIILNQGGYGKFKDSRGRYSATKYHNWVRSHRAYASLWRPYLNRTLIGVQVIDDRGASNWGGKPITNAQIEQMARWWKQVVPGITTFVSGGYAWNLVGYKWRYLDGSINQYNASYMGDVRAWRDRSVAAARSARTSLILSMNVLNGGKNVRGCYRGGRGHMCSMSARELRTYGAALAAAPGICGMGTWMYSSKYQARPGITYSLKYIARLAANRAPLSCKRR